MDDCIFCKIAAGQIPSKTVYEDDEIKAFHDIRPAAPVHLLIMPKKHLPSVAQCGEEDVALLGRLMRLAPKLAEQFGCGYRPAADGGKGEGGFKTMINTGPAGGQEVYHLHIHVLGSPQH